MNLGGPVWHASAAPMRGIPVRDVLRNIALAALRGVGDPTLGEWEEWTGRAFHVRRRLSAAEQRRVGDVVDIRGTPEVEQRLARVRHLLPAGWTE
jgi:hypothetical protein